MAAADAEHATNRRNGSMSKTVLTGDGKLPIETPRNRSLEPVPAPGHARRDDAVA